MFQRTLWLFAPMMMLYTSYSLAEEVVQGIPMTESFQADWSAFNTARPETTPLTQEELTERKREFAFQSADTAQEITSSLRVPFLPGMIETGTQVAREVYRFNQNINKRHIHLDISPDGAKVKWKFKF